VIEVDSVTPNVKKGYNVVFKINDGTISSEWINEYGIWRIASFGDFAAGDKSFVEKKEKELKDLQNVRTNPDFQISASYAYIFNLESAIAIDLKFRDNYQGYGLKTLIGIGDERYIQVEGTFGGFVPIKIKKVGLTPFLDIGVGFIITKNKAYTADSWGEREYDFSFDLSFQPGLMFTTAAVPGLYFQTAYQFNLVLDFLDSKNKNPHVLSVGIGYCY
jgi:hypothetical protein